MRTNWVALLLFTIATHALSQEVPDRASPVAEETEDVVTGSVDLRYGRIATVIDQRNISFDAGRQSSLGITFTLEGKRFVGEFAYEHDYESIFGVLARADRVDSGEFARDRFEYAAGYALFKHVTFHAGARNERIDFSSKAFKGTNPFGFLEQEYFAFLVGARVQTSPELPIGLFGTFRTYFGGTGVGSVRRLTDTKGYRLEAGVPIRLGRSVVRLTPGFIYETVETGRDDLLLRTRRIFLNVGVRARSGG